MTKPYTLHRGDCLAVMRTMADASVDAVVTDPPYELGFMGKSWDSTGIAYSVDMWREALRVLKPGGHLLAFSGSRTYHRMACAIEDAGFEVRDRFRYEQSAETKYSALFDSLTADQRGAVMELLNDQAGLGSEIAWAYGSGFPKSRDIGKAIDKEAGAAREVIGKRTDGRYAYEFNGTANRPTGAAAGTDDAERIGGFVSEKGLITAPATADAATWSGWGTALKPAHEPICVARKPLIGTVAANVLAHGTGALNIDGCRVHGEDSAARAYTVARTTPGATQNATGKTKQEGVVYEGMTKDGRWPANIIHDGSAEVVALFPAQAGAQAPVTKRNGDTGRNAFGAFAGNIDEAGSTFQGDHGSAARFFYCAKTSRTDRNEGLASSDASVVATDATMREVEDADWSSRNGNHHPTVKPTDLMAYLVRLVTPPGGLVLDPFMGSGSTGKACMREGFHFVGIDMTDAYVDIATARIEHELARTIAANTPPPPPPQMDLFAGESHAA